MVLLPSSLMIISGIRKFKYDGQPKTFIGQFCPQELEQHEQVVDTKCIACLLGQTQDST